MNTSRSADEPVPPASDDAADVDDMPWAPREHPWHGAEAESRALAWAGGDPMKLASVFLYRAPNGNPATERDYRFPVADIIDGRPERVLRAVYAAAARLDQASIPESGRSKVKQRITKLYHEAAEAFGDSTIRAPWEK